MLDYENQFNPFVERKETITLWKKYAIVEIEETEGLIKQARNLLELGIKSKDALHIACALVSKCHYFITTDYKILNKNASIENIYIVSPQEFVKFIDGESIDEN